MELKQTKGAVALGLTLFLAACGGGGYGGREMPATGDLKPDNYVATAGESIKVFGLGLDSSHFLDLAYPADAGSAAPAASLDFRWLQRELVEHMSKRATREAPAYVTNELLPCSGGGYLKITEDFASREVYVRGDKVRISSQECVIDGQQVTGTIEATLADVVDSSSRFYMRMDVRANAFGTTAYRINGAATTSDDVQGNFHGSNPMVTRRARSYGFSGFTITGGSPAQTVTLDHGYELVRDYVNNPGYTLTLNGLIHTGGQSYRLEQQTPFVLSTTTSYPQSGTLHLKDKDGDRVILKATATRFTFAFQPAGSNTATQGPVDGPLYSSMLGGSGSVSGGSTQPASGN